MSDDTSFTVKDLSTAMARAAWHAGPTWAMAVGILVVVGFALYLTKGKVDTATAQTMYTQHAQEIDRNSKAIRQLQDLALTRGRDFAHFTETLTKIEAQQSEQGEKLDQLLRK